MNGNSIGLKMISLQYKVQFVFNLHRIHTPV